ncbi:MAG: GGDEF domain-containing protein [Desulfovibrio sp.]|jgi:diguanylate cyclase (GGDEF)-like protein|nr:GGDEF domain-containing protein [Desulfovibrio sp.]
MKSKEQKYWIHLLDQLNSSASLETVLLDTLRELCVFFGFGVGFVYEADYRGRLHCACCNGTYQYEIQESISEDFFCEEELNTLKSNKSLIFRENTTKTPLMQKMADFFSAKSLVFVPVFDQKDALIICAGIFDRRGKERRTDEDMDFTRAVLTSLGTYVKMRIYQGRVLDTRQTLDNILNHMGVDVYVNDFETHEVLYVNRSMAEPYGGMEKMLGTICWQSLYDDKTEECDFCPKNKLLDEKGKPTKTYGWDYQRPFDGSWFKVLSTAFPWVDGRMVQVISSIDITKNKKNEEIIRQMAEYDALTCLPNRYRLINDCEAKLSRLALSNEKIYLLFFDLDGFKPINDDLGHPAGDDLLQKIGVYLRASPLTGENCYRYGGDEFVVLCDPDTPGTLAQVVEYIRERFRNPWQVGGVEVACGISLGISCIPDDTMLVSELLRMADVAMYQSKKEGKGRVHLFNNGTIISWEDYLTELNEKQ